VVEKREFTGSPDVATRTEVSSTPSSTRRRITLLDLLILIAATAAGLALLRVCKSGLGAQTLSMWRITEGFVIYAGLMIAGSWLALALGARWQIETNWVGWAGRILGIGWIGLLLFGFLRIFV